MANRIGLLEIAKGRLNQAKAEWKHYLLSQPLMNPKTKPIDRFADNINMFSARKQSLEEESRALNKLLHEKEEKKNVINLYVTNVFTTMLVTRKGVPNND